MHCQMQQQLHVLSNRFSHLSRLCRNCLRRLQVLSTSLARMPCLSVPCTAGFARQPSGSQQVGGPYLGLEPGLGITTPLLDQHKHGKSAAGTPSSITESESVRPFGGVPASPPGVGMAEATTAAAEAAASIAAAGASAARAAEAEAESKKELSLRQMQNSVLYGEGG